MSEISGTMEINKIEKSLETDLFKEIKPSGDITSEEAKGYFDDLFSLDNTELQNLAEWPKTEIIDGHEHSYDDFGQEYRIDKDLIPNVSYELNGYRHYTDEIGRCGAVEGQLHLKSHEGRLPIRDSIEDIGKGFQREGDDRGHLIGDQFGGSNGLENMVPQNAEINRNDFMHFENDLAKQVKEGSSVYVKVEPIYEGDSFRPDNIVVEYNINGVDNIRIFPNSKEAA